MNNNFKRNIDMTYNQASRAEIRATTGETLLMTAMVSFAPVALSVMTALGAAL